MNRALSILVCLSLNVISVRAVLADQPEIINPLIDTDKFLQEVDQAQALRLQNRVTEAQFAELTNDPAVLVLDARSERRYMQMHLKGAKHLNFADFTTDSLAKLIPSKNTKILIYCNNNILNSPEAFPSKAISAALNLSTFTSLFSYGYKNVYELGPAIDPASSILKFEGALVTSTPTKLQP